ncbi:MAG: septum formation initiator family protein [Terriglobia bacterium]
MRHQVRAPRTWAELQKPAARRANPTAKRVVVLTVLVAVIAWSLYPLKIHFEQRRQIDQIKEELSAVRHDNKLLVRDIRLLQTLDHVELLARENLGMVRPGEEAYVVSDSKAEVAIISDPGDRQETQVTWSGIKMFLRNRY